ncbi:MAG: hypothetical protein JXJ04_14330 [Spirochaetales bacterium]|nr:hypothetical protein [Spirochaetales bacterium]
MKKIYHYIIACVILSSIFFLVACHAPMDGKSEGLEIALPMAQIYTLTGEEYFAHVYLLVGNELFPLGGSNNYVEKGLDEEADQEIILVENIPAGQYSLWLGIGTKRAENGAFNVHYYYESSEFELVAGSTTHIDCVLLDCPFDKALNVLGENINGAVINTIGANPTTLYASGPKNLYSFSGVYNGPDFNVVELYNETDFPNYSINSVSKGLNYTGVGAPTNYLFLSTTIGISKWDGNATIDNTFSAGLGEVNVLRSLAYPDGNNLSVYFQRNGGLGGVAQDALTPTDWVNVDYTEFLKDQLVWDFCVTDNLTNNAGYFATALGSLRVPQIILENYTEGQEVRLMSQVDFFSIIDSNTEEEIPIISLGYDAATTSLYMGTFKGLFHAQVPDIDTSEPLSETPVLLEETAGKRIYMVLLNNTYRAYASNTHLFLQEKLSGNVVSLPFVAGLPGDISAMDWHGNTLIISGNLGLVALNVDTLFL